VAFRDARCVERPAQADDQGVVRLRENAGVAELNAGNILGDDQPFRAQEADRELGLVPRRAHGDRHGNRLLSRPRGLDFEWLLADEPILTLHDRPVTEREDTRGGLLTTQGGCRSQGFGA